MEIKQKTHIINAQNYVIGRLASKVAILLRGKNKPSFRPNVDGGDDVVVYNMKNVKVSGDKLKQKLYKHHTGYPGSLKSVSLEVMMQKSPEKTLRLAVMRMLPKNKLRDRMIKKLKVYDGKITK